MKAEDKAKAYDEVVNRLKGFMMRGVDPLITRADVQDFFPELATSEDERIRKDIIWCLKHSGIKENRPINPHVTTITKDAIAWLEKQNEIDKTSYDIAEKEKYDFVSGQFIECRKSFNEFKEDNSYWLEYVGNDTYIGRSDNILNKKFHITPRQLYRLFTQQHCPKENNVNDETNAPTEYGKYVDDCLNEASKHFFSEGEDKYTVADLFYAGVRCGKSWLEKQGEIIDEYEDKLDRCACESFDKGYKAALEKQCEQKPINDTDEDIVEAVKDTSILDMVEPKFKVDDWVVWDNKISCHIDNTHQGKESLMYTITDVNNMTRSYSVKSFDNNARLWTIQDAKDGDVLFEDSCIFIIKKLGDNSTAAKTYCTLYNDGDFDDGSILFFDIDSTKPATKEQRNLLFHEMHEEGYEWDAEKKELKKIHIIDEGKAEMDYCFTKMMNSEKVSPTWSEEDEKNLRRAIRATQVVYPVAADWLKFLKNRIKGE